MIKTAIFRKKTYESCFSSERFFVSVPIANRFSYLNSKLPQTACLARKYNWLNKDLPNANDTVQWLLLFEYIWHIGAGNFLFQKCWMIAPTSIKRKLFPYMLKKLYPDIQWSGSIPMDDLDAFLPIRQQIIRLGGLIFRTSDIPFVVDSAYPWPGNDASGAVEFDTNLAIGKSCFLHTNTLNWHSLRSKIRGEIGPVILAKSKTADKDQRVIQHTTPVPLPPQVPEEDKNRPTGPTGTFIESNTSLEKLGYLKKTNQDIKNEQNQAGYTLSESSSLSQGTPKLVLPQISENLEELFTGEIPTAKLPGDADRTFLISGITQGILGQGGMGRVYKILLKHLEVVRALKILQPSGVGNNPHEWRKFCVRFLREIKILSNLHHTHIAQIHGFGEWEKYPFIEMEYVPGSNLKSLIDTTGQVPLAVTTSVAIQVARALSHAHNKTYMLDGQMRRGVIHRDMKPQNVIVSQEGESKLLDFGVALPMGMVTQTMQSNFVGTIQYAAPEQIEGVDYDQRIDIYSFGQVIYEMICGKPAFHAPTIQSMLQIKMANQYPDLDTSGIKVPKALRSIVRTCMEINPENRFRTSEDLLASLEEAHRDITRETPDAVVRDYVRCKDFTMSINRDVIDANKPGLLNKLSFWK